MINSSSLLSSKIEVNINIILCFTCKNKIPFIKIITDEEHIRVQLKCECIKELITMELETYLDALEELNKTQKSKCWRDTHAINKAEKYCSMCQKWLCQDCLVLHNEMEISHIIFNKEVNLSCNEHKLGLNRYCYDCEKSICISCANSHQTHCTTQLNNSKCEFSIKDIENIINTNEKYNVQFNQWTDACIHPNESWKTEINKAYYKNLYLNIELKELCQLIIQTAATLGKHVNNSLSQTITAINVAENTELQVTSSDLQKSYEILLKHYTQNYALIINKKPIPFQQDNEHTYQSVKYVTKRSGLILKIIQLQDGRLISSDKCEKIKVWSSFPFTVFRKFSTESGLVLNLIQLQDGRLVTSGENKIFKVWSISTFECLKSFEGHSSSVTALIQLQDDRLVSSCIDSMIQIWSISTFECLKSFKRLSYTFSFFSYLPFFVENNSIIQLKDGRLVSNINEIMKVWCIYTFECLKSIKGHFYKITSLLQLQDGRLVSYSNDSLIKIWCIFGFECLNSYNTNSQSTNILIQLQDGRLLSCGKDNLIKLWSVSKFECLQTFGNINSKTYAVIQLRDGRLGLVSEDIDWLDILDDNFQNYKIIFEIWD